MDVEDIFRRIFLAYWAWILLLVVAGVGAPAVYHLKDKGIYTSSVRFVIDVTDPQITTESTADSDAVRSIATSPSHVQNALDVAGVKRDPTTFAARNVVVQPLGSSGVMELQVKDVDPYAAATIANALAADVIATRTAISRTQALQMIDSLTAQISSFDTRIANLDAQTANFRAYPVDELNGLYSERNSLAQERLVLETQRAQIQQALALRPQGGIIDSAQPAMAPDSSRAPGTGWRRPSWVRFSATREIGKTWPARRCRPRFAWQPSEPA